MSEKAPSRRLIICVDGHEFDDNSSKGYPNISNVYRISRIIPAGKVSNDDGSYLDQSIKYYRAVGDGASFSDKLKNRYSAATFEQQIKQIVHHISSTLTSSQDELCFFGCGRGAYIVRAVAGLLHHMGLPKRASLRNFEEIYQKAVDLLKFRFLEDGRQGSKCVEYLHTQCDTAPQVHFLGLFDTVKYPAEQNKHDIGFLPSQRHLRHALAFNEARASYAPEFYVTPAMEQMDGRTFVQAWFLGAHNDMSGGSQHDGLSLYPLQWMIVEAMKAGINFRANTKEGGKNSSLALAFPQYTGDMPTLGSGEKIEWQITFANGLAVSMYDLATVHGSKISDTDPSSHTVRINDQAAFYNTPRRVFDGKKRLAGWREEGPFGTIVHPSMYCILDRYPRMYEQHRFKSLKEEFATFQENNMRDNEAPVPPWLEDMQLQASGVKAFRILVCGKTGVGKSTLINKVFGVEMTEESNSYAQGVHDINQAFESPNHPGLLIHDSRGWQAGSDKELELIAKFLRHRAYQKNPAEALHVIWFCVDSDVSRIEEADKRTFETIAQYSHHVPVFVIGTKKDKLVAYRKGELLEKYMESTGDFKKASALAAVAADKLADEQFQSLREQLSKIPHYKADGFSCISKDDDVGVRQLLTITLELISDDRVRLFCVAAQVVDVEQKIDSAITECMRLSTHAIRTAMVPLPCSGIIGTPTVSRILCEHVLQCFGFPKAKPAEVDEIMSKVVLKNLKAFMAVSMTHFMTSSIAAVGLAVGTAGAGILLGAASCVVAAPPTARMLFKCACDMILILERSFRYKGKFVSVKQIEDAAIYYTTSTTKTFSGKDKLLQEHVHEEIERLIPLKKVSVGIRFQRLRSGMEEIIYKNRFDKSVGITSSSSVMSSPSRGQSLQELPASSRLAAELDNPPPPHTAELDAEEPPPHSAELMGDIPIIQSPDRGPFDDKKGIRVDYGYGFGSQSQSQSAASTNEADTMWSFTDDNTSTLSRRMGDMDISESPSATTPLSPDSESGTRLTREKSEGNILSRGWKSMGTKKMKGSFSLKKSKTHM